MDIGDDYMGINNLVEAAGQEGHSGTVDERIGDVEAGLKWYRLEQADPDSDLRYPVDCFLEQMPGFRGKIAVMHGCGKVPVSFGLVRVNRTGAYIGTGFWSDMIPLEGGAEEFLRQVAHTGGYNGIQVNAMLWTTGWPLESLARHGTLENAGDSYGVWSVPAGKIYMH